MGRYRGSVWCSGFDGVLLGLKLDTHAVLSLRFSIAEEFRLRAGRNASQCTASLWVLKLAIFLKV